MTIKTPPSEDAARCLEIRKQSKRGFTISKEDRKFCETMNNAFPEWYDATQEQVFNDTVPLGSDARYSK